MPEAPPSAQDGISICRVTLENAHVLNAVADDIFDHEISQTYLQAYLLAPGHALFDSLSLGVVVGQIRGMTQFHPDKPGELYIDNLGVAQSHRRHGIARRLVRALVEWGAGEKCETVWVATEPDCKVARAFYAAMGFEKDEALVYSGPLSLSRPG